MDDIEEDEGTDPNEARVFNQVIQGLGRQYPEEKFGEISTSFCFICLLHLANEKGLVITKTPELNELDIRKDWTAEITAGGD